MRNNTYKRILSQIYNKIVNYVSEEKKGKGDKHQSKYFEHTVFNYCRVPLQMPENRKIPGFSVQMYSVQRPYSRISESGIGKTALYTYLRTYTGKNNSYSVYESDRRSISA